ncbi:MAG: prephenate dehydratase domain-containing protein [Candidatus Paceibacterota bacterium]
MHKVTFLGPVRATFSHDAYDILADIYGAPRATAIGQDSNCIPAATNGEILRLVAGHGGYGAIAMETIAEGRVTEPLESFIDLLKLYGNGIPCPFHVVGAIRLRLHFCLMARSGVDIGSIDRVLAHPKALGACRARLSVMNVLNVGVSSNGEGARLVAQSDEHRISAALGPRSASEKYGLTVLDEAFEDSEAITTFFLVAPTFHVVSVGARNRSLVVFKVAHSPGALVRALQSFEAEGLNLIQIHSVHAGNCTYNFAIEIDVGGSQVPAFERAMKAFEGHVERHLVFGPFEVVSR